MSNSFNRELTERDTERVRDCMVDPSEQYCLQWKNNPEPDKEAISLDGRVILDTDDATADAYLWERHNAGDGWLAYDGELTDIEQ